MFNFTQNVFAKYSVQYIQGKLKLDTFLQRGGGNFSRHPKIYSFRDNDGFSF